MRHQPLQTVAGCRRQILGQGQGQAEVQAGQGCTQFVGHRVEQVSLLVEQVFDIAGHGVEHRRQFADIGAWRDIRAFAELPLAEAPGGLLEAFQITPVRAQPEQQAGQQRRPDQYVHAPVQQVDVQRIGRDLQGHRPLLIQRRHRQGPRAPLAKAQHILAAAQALLLRRAEARVIDTGQADLQGSEALVQARGHCRPLLFRYLAELFDQQALQAPRLVHVVAHETLVEDPDHQLRHQIDRRAEGDDGDQVQPHQDLQHGFSIPTRSD